MEIIPEHSTGLIYLTKEDYKNFDIQRGDTEGIVKLCDDVERGKSCGFYKRATNPDKN